MNLPLYYPEINASLNSFAAEYGLSREDLARMLNMSRSAFYARMSCKTHWTIEEVQLIAHITGVSIDKMLEHRELIKLDSDGISSILPRITDNSTANTSLVTLLLVALGKLPANMMSEVGTQAPVTTDELLVLAGMSGWNMSAARQLQATDPMS